MAVSGHSVVSQDGEALFFGREPPSAAQVGALDLRALDQLRAATGGHDLSGLHHIAPVVSEPRAIWAFCSTSRMVEPSVRSG